MQMSQIASARGKGLKIRSAIFPNNTNNISGKTTAMISYLPKRTLINNSQSVYFVSQPLHLTKWIIILQLQTQQTLINTTPCCK